MIDISKLNKAEVLAALYNASEQQGMGILHERGRTSMSVEEAEQELENSKHFDYLHGRVMKISLDKDMMWAGLYDRDNGEGAAQRALDPLFAKLS